MKGKNSPSPEIPSDETRTQIPSRSTTRAASEPATENSPSPDGSVSSLGNGMSESERLYRNSRAGSEAPQRFPQEVLNSRGGSARSSRAGSEVPDRMDRTVGPSNATPKRGGPRGKVATPPPTAERRGGNSAAKVAKKILTSTKSVSDHIHETEAKLYHTLSPGKGSFAYYQRLHYPIDTTPPTPPDESKDLLLGTSSDREGSGSEPSPQPMRMSGGGASSSGGTPEASPEPVFDEASFNAAFESGTGFLQKSGEALDNSFSLPPHTDEAVLNQSVSALAFTTLPDPVTGAPVLGVCLGDYNGHIEYFEVSSNDANNKAIRLSRSLSKARSLSRRDVKSSSGSTQHTRSNSLDSEATNNILEDMKGREVARRHSHKAYVKTINALTSVAVEPCVKCLAFVRPLSSPSMTSYLTANERVIKLFHVRREGFSPFNVFPGMESVIGRTYLGSRYFSRMPSQSLILPIKEYGPVTNSIQALSVSADGETFMSVEDLQVFWWSFEATDTTKAACIADLRPASGVLDEVEELVTAASFHPTHSSLFLLSRSSGVLNIGDLRDPPSREKRQYAITTQVTASQNPTSCPSYDEILCNISGASFLGPDHVITRDYLSLKLWDLRKPNLPYSTVPVMNYVARYLDLLYENDSIFDRFPIAVDDISGTVITGLYDGAVAVWQPMNNALPPDEQLVHYRVDPFSDPTEYSHGGRVTLSELESTLESAWQTSPRTQSGTSAEEALGPPPDEVPEPFTNKVLNLGIAPGGERFGYTYKTGKLVYVFERSSA